jgi:hypothetical protein
MSAISFTIDGITLGSTFIPGQATVTYDPGTETVSPDVDGNPAQKFCAAMQASPVFTVSTLNVGTIIDLFTSSSVIIAKSLADFSGGLTLHFTRNDEVGRASGSVHHRAVATVGTIYPVSLAPTQNGLAQLTIECRLAGGATDPVTYSSTNAAPTQTGTIASMWTLGIAKINGTAIADTTGWTLNFGFAAESLFADGNPYPRVVTVNKQQPTAEVATDNLLAIGTVGRVLALNGTTGLQVFLREVPNKSLPAADATTTAYRFSLLDGMATTGQTSGSFGATTSISVMGVLGDGDTGIVTVATGAIS